MAQRSMTAEEAQIVLDLVQRHGGNVSAASAASGTPRGTLKSRYQRAQQLSPSAIYQDGPSVPIGDPVPPKTLPAEDIIAHHEKAFALRKAHAAAQHWQKFRVPIDGPYAVMVFGDPHLDDDGCDLSLFKAHAELAANTKGLYAANIGDTTNNWAGRLARLWADQNTSAETSRVLIKHYLADSGIPWFLWLHGNHDMWDGPVGRDVFKRFQPHYVEMRDWQAKITLVSPNGHEIRIHAAHNFKGNSIWNNLHGLERAAQLGDAADLYVAGHHHDSGLRQSENPHRGGVYNLMRVRGYKFMDHYADLHGFGEYQYGSAGVAVIDPCADKLNHVTCFLDPFEGVEFLKFKRRNISV